MMSPVGTKRTNWAGLTMSVHRGGPEVAGRWPNRRDWHEPDMTVALINFRC